MTKKECEYIGESVRNKQTLHKIKTSMEQLQIGFKKLEDIYKKKKCK